MLSYLKTQGFTDSFLASMRALNVVAGLLGTVTASWVEKKVGSVRGGSWSIWFVPFLVYLQAWAKSLILKARSEFVCLIPVVIALLPGNGTTNAVNAVLTVMLFGGMSIFYLLKVFLISKSSRHGAQPYRPLVIRPNTG